VPNVKALRAQFAQKDGEWFNATMFSKGLISAQVVWSLAISTWLAIRRLRSIERETIHVCYRHRRGKDVLCLGSSLRAIPYDLRS